MTNAQAAANARKPYADAIKRIEGEKAALRTALDEFIADIDAVGSKQVGQEWPDLLVTYNKARAAIAIMPGTAAGSKAPNSGNCQALLESVHDELEGMGFGTDDSIDGGDCCEYLGKLFVDVGEALERDGAKVAA